MSMIRLGAAGILLAALGCASTAPKAPIPPAARVYLTAANEAIDAGNFDKAREQIKALKAMPKSASLDEAIEGTSTRLLGMELGVKVRNASSLKIEPARIAYGQQALVTLEIKNPEQQPLRFPAPQSAIALLRDRKDGGFYGRLTESAISTDAYGNQIRDKSEKTFASDDEIVIEPGQSWVQQSRIASGPEAYATLRSYQLFYTLRAPRVIFGDQETAFPELRIGPATMQMFPAGYEALESDPVGVLKKALESPEEKFDAHVFLCAALAKPEQKNEVVRLLAGALTAPDKSRRRSAMAGLRWITGAGENGFEEDRWIAWWESHRKNYEERSAG